MRKEDYEGFGVYERTAGDTGMLDAMAYGVYTPFGALPADVTALFLPVFTTEQRDGMVFVQPTAKEPAIAALDLLVFNGTPDATSTNVTGSAEMPAGAPAGSWVQDYVTNGYVVMVDMGQGGQVHAPPYMVACSKDPQAVASTAAIGKNVCIIDGPASVIAAASSIAMASAPASASTQCPGGAVWVPGLNQCVASASGTPNIPWLPGIPTIVPGVTPASQQAAAQPIPGAPTSKWVVPVLLAAGALVVVGIVYETTKKPVVARRNRR